MPARREDGGGCRIHGGASFRSVFHPGVDCSYFRIAQAAVVYKLTEGGVRMPRGHFALENAFSNHPCKRENFVVAHERHRCDVVRAMAGHAVPVQNGCYIFTISDLCFWRGVVPGACQCDSTESNVEEN